MTFVTISVWPLPLSADEEINGIAISWNEIYSSMKEHLKKHSVPKGEALEKLESLLGEAVKHGEFAMELNKRLERCEITMEQLRDSMRKREARVSDLYIASGDLPFPPEDLKRYDEVAQIIFADVDNLFLYFRDSGLEKWSDEQRQHRFRDTIQQFEEDLSSLRYEQKMIH